MKPSFKLLVVVILTLMASATSAQKLIPEPKSSIDIVRNGNLLIVKNTSGKELTAIDMDKPVFKGKVVAVTYSAKKNRSNAENAVHAVTVFPNPTSQQVRLQLTGSWNYPVNVQICDKNGDVMHTSQLESSEHQIDIGSLSQGIYLLKAQSGNARAVGKLIVN